MVQELLRHTDITARNVDLGGAQRGRHRRAHATAHTVVLHVTTSLCDLARGASASGTGITQRGIDDGHPDPLIAQPLGDLERHRRERSDRDEQHIVAETVGRPRQDVDARKPLECGNVLAHFTFGEPDGGRAVVDLQRLAQLLAQPGAVARRGHPDAGNDVEDRQIPHAVVAGAVVAGDPGPVEHHGDRQLVQGDVHHDLVERAVEERRIDRHHRVQPAHRQPGRRGHRVLLGDPDVEQPIREAFPERRQTGRAGHRRGDRHDVAALGGIRDQRLGEHRRPPRRRGLGGQPGVGVDHPAGVHLLGLVVLGRRIAHALAGHHVHDHRGVEAAGMPQGGLHRVLVVPVDRADVLQAEVGEHHLRGQRVLDAGLHAVHGLVAGLADDRHTAHGDPGALEQPLVARLQAQPGQVVGQTADGRGVGAAVVVDDDDHRPAGGGDVVQRLPAHAAGQCAVADHRHDVAVAVTGQLEGLGQPVGVGQRRRGVAGLDPVVLAFGPGRIARQAVAFAQRVEVGRATGEHLVHVRLMAGVEEDRVVRRVEDPVQRQRQLDDTEVGPEVATCGSDLVNQELANLGSQLGQLRLGQVLQIGGAANLFKHLASLRTPARISPDETRRCRARRRGRDRGSPAPTPCGNAGCAAAARRPRATRPANFL